MWNYMDKYIFSNLVLWSNNTGNIKKSNTIFYLPFRHLEGLFFLELFCFYFFRLKNLTEFDCFVNAMALMLKEMSPEEIFKPVSQAGLDQSQMMMKSFEGFVTKAGKHRKNLQNS